jgi:hypothetical protein
MLCLARRAVPCRCGGRWCTIGVLLSSSIRISTEPLGWTIWRPCMLQATLRASWANAQSQSPNTYCNPTIIHVHVARRAVQVSALCIGRVPRPPHPHNYREHRWQSTPIGLGARGYAALRVQDMRGSGFGSQAEHGASMCTRTSSRVVDRTEAYKINMCAESREPRTRELECPLLGVLVCYASPRKFRRAGRLWLRSDPSAAGGGPHSPAHVPERPR